MTEAGSLKHVLMRAERVLSTSGVRSPDTDAVALLGHVLGVPRSQLSLIDRISNECAEKFMELVTRRACKEPLAYLTGEVTLRGITLQVGPGVFVPRRHSEPMLERAVQHLAGRRAPLVVDLCAGSGALAFVIAAEVPSACVIAVEMSDDALGFASLNAIRRWEMGDPPVALVRGDVFDPSLLEPMYGEADLVIANPPYVPESEPLPAEWATHQPAEALWAPGYGLSVLRAVVDRAASLLTTGGRIFVEHGDGQAPELAQVLITSGLFSDIQLCDDQDGAKRYVIAVRNPEGNRRSAAAKQSHTLPRRSSSWMRTRVEKASDTTATCFREGLTGHVFTSREGKHVLLRDGTEAVEFVSCSYLGLEQHPSLKAAAVEAIERYGVHFSSSRARMRPPYLRELEEMLTAINGNRRTVCFTSVSSVHLGLLPLIGSGVLPGMAIGNQGIRFLVDKSAHASMQVLRGIMQQFGPVERVDVSSPGAVETAVRRRGTPILLVDGVGSMGGLTDVAHLRKVVAAEGGYLYVDDAHGTSITGPRGSGYAYQALGGDLSSVVLVGSLSKAFGGSGAYVVLPGSADAEVVLKAANPLVFGHSIMLPLLAATHASASMHLSDALEALQIRLHQRLATFDRLTGHRLVSSGLLTPIRGARFASEDAAVSAARRLRRNGVLILPAFYPTVAEGTGLLRFAISADHSDSDLQRAAHALAD